MRTGQGRGPGPPKGQAADTEACAQERVQAGIFELLAAFKTLKVQALSNVLPSFALATMQHCCLDYFDLSLTLI